MFPAALIHGIADIETPCINVCILDPVSGLCRGCGRTGDEIASWLSYTPDERRRVMATLSARLASQAAPVQV
jgi:predicted Fe-S protein YdhL (DUF1289 family)